ncbi:glycosyltransferase [Candidatus Poribacteria bacterium]|nr:glycosyltransferase [Candidatus Poribacteria bacterium]
MKVLFFGSYDPDYPRNKILREGLALAGVTVLECNVPFWEGLRFHDRYRRLLRAVWNIGNGWDVMITPEFNQKNIPLAAPLAAYYRRPLVFDPLVSFYNTNVEDRQRVGSKGTGAFIQKAWDKTGFLLADNVWADTNEHKKYFHKKFNVSLKSLDVVPVGADDDVFSPSPWRGAGREFVVAFLGSYVPLHGVECIMEAALLLKSEKRIRFKLIGSGQVFDRIKAMRELYALPNVDMLPSVLYREIPQAMSDADVCLGVFGGTDKASRVVPNKVYAALAMRKPVVTGDSPAIREMFEDGVHLCACKMADPLALADAIRLLADSPELRRSLAWQGHEFVMKNFSRKMIGERAKRILARTVEERNK